MDSHLTNSKTKRPPAEAPPDPPKSTSFLFVNESSSTAGKKVGRRSDIKSHVRNHTVQRQKKHQKKSDGQASLDSESPVDEDAASTTFRDDVNRKGKGKEKSFQKFSTQGVAISEWIGATPLLEVRKDSVPEEESETNWYGDHQIGGQFPISLNSSLPQPNVVSDVLERAIAYTAAGTSSQPRGRIGLEYEMTLREHDPGLYYHPRRNSGSMNLPIGRGFASDEIPPSGMWSDCDVCGDPGKAWMTCDEHGSVWERQGRRQEDHDEGTFRHTEAVFSKRQAFATRPLDQLGKLSHGRVDPFVSYPSLVDDPSGTLNELLDHSVTYLLPGLIADSSKTTPSLLTTAWTTAARNTPLLFHALIFSASIHLSFLRTSTIQPNSQIPLRHKQAVIHELNKVLSSPTERIRDEIILAILILSSHEVMDLEAAEERCFDSPLTRMQWLNVYGNIRNVQAHLMAVMHLVNLRGGVESLELYGLAELLIGGDVVAATTALSKPAFAPLKRSSAWLTTLFTWTISPPRPPHLHLGSAFSPFTLYGLTPQLLTLLNTISAVTTAISHHLAGEYNGVSLTTIARTRTACQQRLLSLPDAFEIADVLSEYQQPCVYEPVRLAANIYTIAVVFPIPRPAAVLRVLARRLVQAIEGSEMMMDYGLSLRGEDEMGLKFKDLLLWMLMLGGIAALDMDVDVDVDARGGGERDWYINQLVAWARRWEVGEWRVVEEVLGGFLWLNSACARSGRKLWMLVCERRALIEAEAGVDMWLVG